MDQVLVNGYEDVLRQSKKVLEIENKNWPSYVRSEFAELRSVVKKVDERKKHIDSEISLLLAEKIMNGDI